MVPNRHLKQARELRGWSQAKVASEIGTDATTVSRWERGLFSPTPYFRERLCTLFGKNTEELGLLASMDQSQAYERGAASCQPPAEISSLQPDEWLSEDVYAEDSLVPMPPNWSDSTDIFTYILHSAAHDQQAHMLWKDAYVRALQGQCAEAQQLGEASLRAFECIGHVNARAVREWLNQLRFVSGPPSSPNIPAVTLPRPPEQLQPVPKRLLPQRGTRIALILIGSFRFLLSLDLPSVR